MVDSKKSGKAVLRAVDGRKASGVCQYSVDTNGMEAHVSVQIPDGGDFPLAVLQFGLGKGYRCTPPAALGGALRSAEAGVMAVWVTEGGAPVLFAQLLPGAFDAGEARKHLSGAEAQREEIGSTKKTVSVKAVPASAAAEPSPVLLLGSGSQPPHQAAIKAPSAQPLVVRRAPRPTPRPPVYSPLWDDVSVEFEKMLANLPPAQPFNGNTAGTRIAEMPLGGAVQCYIGSVEIKGMKVFLQAVPARPFARPAGFDHSLVSRDGETFWVKYFIQE
jgi:hypothetical protein